MSITRLIMEFFQRTPRYLIVLYTVVFIFSVTFAIFGLSKQLTFGFDQARDAYEAFAIWHNHDFKILGPSSDIQGVHHGVLWYYSLVLPYAIGSGNPEVVAVIFFILSSLTIPLCGYFTYKLFKNFHVSLLASIFYASSPLFQVYTRWLSNPLIALYVVPLLLLFLWKYINFQNRYLAGLIGLFYGFLIQSDIAFGLFIFTVPMFWFTYKVKLKLQDFAFFGAGFLLGISTYLVSEIQFNGKAISAIIHFFNSNLSSGRSIQETSALIIERINELLSISVLPFPLAIFIFIALVGLYILNRLKNENEKKALLFLAVWMSTFFIFYLFKSGFLQSGFMFTPFLLPLVVIFSYILIRTVRNSKLLAILLICIFLAQFYTSYLWLKTEYSPLSVQYGISLSFEKEIIDYTYEQSLGEKFIIITITNPLHINTTWAYLYEFYGQKKYKYLPFYGGKGQEGYLGSLSEQPFGTKYRYLIIEPTTGIPNYFIQQIIFEENKSSDIAEQKKFGQFVVQKRIFRENKHNIE